MTRSETEKGGLHMTTHIYHFTEPCVFLVLSHWIEVMDKTSPRICEVSPEPHNIWKAMKANLSHDVASGSEITPCNKICKPLVVYRFSGNVMTSIATLRK